MLKITVPLVEDFDETNNKFVVAEGFDLELEHSLASLSKWESRELKPFLGKGEKTSEELLRYIEDMIVTPNPPAGIVERLSSSNVDEINAYIGAPMTATTIREVDQQRPSREIMTAEVFYHIMVALQIPWEAQHWHLNRLIMLIRVCNEKNKPQKQRKFTRSAASQRAELNRQRRAQAGTAG